MSMTSQVDESKQSVIQQDASVGGMVCVVTGAGGGIGRAVARHLARAGARVLVNDINVETSSRVEQELTAAGLEACADVSDAGTLEGADELIGHAERRWGRVDVLVNSASPGIDVCDFFEMSEEAEDRSMHSFFSTVRCIRRAAPGMKERGYGRIVNITSVSAAMGSPGLSMYAASKAGIHGLSRSLAHELADSGVTINCVAPGMVDTSRQQARSSELIRRRLERIPLGRMASVEEIAPAVLFFASRAASYITGEVLYVDGGRP